LTVRLHQGVWYVNLVFSVVLLPPQQLLCTDLGCHCDGYALIFSLFISLIFVFFLKVIAGIDMAVNLIDINAARSYVFLSNLLLA